MTFQRKLLYGAGASVLLTLAVGVFLPSTRTIERTITVDAWPSTLFALADDAGRAAEWLPWTAPLMAPRMDDRSARVALSGPPSGVGAMLAWEGARPGSFQTTASVPGERVAARVALDGTPGTSVLTLMPGDAGTRVRWRLELDFGHDLLARYRSLWRGQALERELDAGLAALKTLAENLPRADFGDLEIEDLVVESVTIVCRTTRSRPDPAAVSAALGPAFFEILDFMSRHGLAEAGPPLSITRTFSGPELVLDACIPAAGGTATIPPSENAIRLARTYEGPALRVTHTGPYRGLADTHRKIAAYLTAHGIERNDDPWEVYVSDPARTEDAERVTLIYYPVKPRVTAE